MLLFRPMTILWLSEADMCHTSQLYTVTLASSNSFIKCTAIVSSQPWPRTAMMLLKLAKNFFLLSNRRIGTIINTIYSDQVPFRFYFSARLRSNDVKVLKSKINLILTAQKIRERTIRAHTDTIRYEYSSIHNGRYRYRYEYSVRWCLSHL